GAIVIAAFFVARLLLHGRDDTSIESHARSGFSLLGAALLAVLLYYEVDGTLLTVAWALEGAALMAAGFPARDRTLRLAGLSLMLFCSLKLFVYDQREMEMLYRILSFLVLGVLLLGASWGYSRYREQVGRYL
ncbi:MAG: DUF2339 domain-containing protein, partial [Longimicrobiales bacterium]